MVRDSRVQALGIIEDAQAALLTESLELVRARGA